MGSQQIFMSTKTSDWCSLSSGQGFLRSEIRHRTPDDDVEVVGLTKIAVVEAKSKADVTVVLSAFEPSFTLARRNPTRPGNTEQC